MNNTIVAMIHKVVLSEKLITTELCHNTNINKIDKNVEAPTYTGAYTHTPPPPPQAHTHTLNYRLEEEEEQ